MDKKVNISLQDGIIIAQIHHLHESLSNIKEFVKETFYEYYFSRSSIIIYQDLLSTKAIDKKREKLISWFIKNSKLNLLNPKKADEITKNYKKQIKIEISTNSGLYQNIATIKLSKYTKDLMILEVKKDSSSIIFSYIRSKFIYNTSRVDKERSKILLNTSSLNFKNILEEIVSKRTIAGKKVLFLYDKTYINEFISPKKEYSSSSSNSSEQESIKEKIDKIKNSYIILKLNSGIKDISVVKKQYHKLAKEYHPDSHFQKSKSEIEVYQDKFLKVKEAYELIREHLERRSA